MPRYVVHVQSFVVEVDRNTSQDGVQEAAFRRLMQDPPRIEAIEEMEVAE